MKMADGNAETNEKKATFRETLSALSSAMKALSLKEAQFLILTAIAKGDSANGCLLSTTQNVCSKSAMIRAQLVLLPRHRG